MGITRLGARSQGELIPWIISSPNDSQRLGYLLSSPVLQVRESKQKEVKRREVGGLQHPSVWAQSSRDAEAPILWSPDERHKLIRKDPDAGKDWGQEEKGGSRGWDGWMTSLTQWTWVWANSGRYWRTGELGMLQSIGSQRVRHNWVTEQQQLHLGCLFCVFAPDGCGTSLSNPGRPASLPAWNILTEVTELGLTLAGDQPSGSGAFYLLLRCPERMLPWGGS